MARGRKPGITGTMEQQIEKVQIRAVKTKAAYDSVVDAKRNKSRNIKNVQ